MYQLYIIINAVAVACGGSSFTVYTPGPAVANSVPCMAIYPEKVAIPYAAYDRLAWCEREAERLGSDRRYHAVCHEIGEGK